MTKHDAIRAELEAWRLEFHPDTSEYRLLYTSYVEKQGCVVSLPAGDTFTPLPDWADFAARWQAIRADKGLLVSVAELAAAMLRTGDPGPDGKQLSPLEAEKIAIEAIVGEIAHVTQ